MPWPDFTELTFGFAYLREFERLYAHGNHFPTAPDFISQNDEATLGYDVEIMHGATPIFLQFKRSKVLTTKNAKEIQDGSFDDPSVFRMHLHKKGSYQQQRALKKLEADGQAVLYVMSQVETSADFSQAFVNERIISEATAHFTPTEIDPPDYTDDHHVSFKAADVFGYVYSDEPRRIRRKIPNVHELKSFLMKREKRSFDGNRAYLTALYQRHFPASEARAVYYARDIPPREFFESIEKFPPEQRVAIAVVCSLKSGPLFELVPASDMELRHGQEIYA